MSEKCSPLQDGVHSKYVLVIHGGAGIITRENSTPEQQANYRKALNKSLKAVSKDQTFA
jgi:beta-aspartyl-peptidase (threonine type)